MALLASRLSGAQPAPAGPASAPTAELTPNERAQRDADKVFKWILIHSDRPRKVGSSRIEEKPAAAVRAKPAARTELAAPNRAAPAAAAPSARSAAAPPSNATAPVADAALTPVSTAFAPPTPIEAGAAPPALAAAEASDETLAPLFRADPQFPPNLLRTLRKGHVQVRFTVLPDGSVAEPGVVSSSNPKLNPSALVAIAQWRFAPLRKPQSGVVDLAFNLD